MWAARGTRVLVKKHEFLLISWIQNICSAHIKNFLKYIIKRDNWGSFFNYLFKKLVISVGYSGFLVTILININKRKVYIVYTKFII